MTSYQDITRQIGDQWVAALKRAEDSIAALAQNVQGAAAKIDVPQVQIPEQVTKFNEAITEKLPKASDILKANFELTERLLAAQKELALKALAAVSGEIEAPVEPAKKAAAKKAAN